MGGLGRASATRLELLTTEEGPGEITTSDIMDVVS